MLAVFKVFVAACDRHSVIKVSPSRCSETLCHYFQADVNMCDDTFLESQKICCLTDFAHITREKGR